MGRVTTNGSRPPLPRRGPHVRRPVALAIGAVAALVVAGMLVAPVVIFSGRSQTKPCAAVLVYRGRSYVARPVPHVVQAVAVGVGVEHGCGAPSQNVDVRSLTGVAQSVAVAVSGESASIYVRRGLCPDATAAGLLACVRRLGS